jgi:hypothetical protein
MAGVNQMHQSKIVFPVFIITFFILSMGCAESTTGNRGSIKGDINAYNEFSIYKINPDLNYYISGHEEVPNALIGLKKSYVLSGSGWKRIEPSQKAYREIIQNMQKKASTHKLKQNGFAVCDDKDEQIGVWYSILSATTSVYVEGGHNAIIIAPDGDTYEKLDNAWKEFSR